MAFHRVEARVIRLIIDGYNLLHAVGILSVRPGKKHLEMARKTLLQRLGNSLRADVRANTTIVFDAGPDAPRGLPAIQKYSGMEIRFARDHKNADEQIMELIVQESAPKSLHVVSGDREIQELARRRRATAWDSETWYDSLSHFAPPDPDPEERNAAEPREPQQSEEQIQSWLRTFGGG
jgi:hypothetical protein